MCMFMCLFFAKLFFYESATFINENSYALQVSVSPNLRKDIYTRKGLNPPNPKTHFRYSASQLIRESQ